MVNITSSRKVLIQSHTALQNHTNKARALLGVNESGSSFVPQLNACFSLENLFVLGNEP